MKKNIVIKAISDVKPRNPYFIRIKEVKIPNKKKSTKIKHKKTEVKH